MTSSGAHCSLPRQRPQPGDGPSRGVLDEAHRDPGAAPRATVLCRSLGSSDTPGCRVCWAGAGSLGGSLLGEGL